ncbi:MAG TPA: zinc-ribbon domain-containing protein, partial [Planctomycetaceae bacterium]|nr:zinc-ribbon domain-containing protein [Planctomycetaceae bacterium]
MPVKVRCPSCEKVLSVPDTARGKAVKCPGCESRVPVPADSPAAAAPAKAGAVKTAAKPAAAKKKAADDDGDSFLSGLDLSKAEDSSVKVCKKCGHKLDEEDEECPECGTMVGTGQLSRAARKARSKGRGPDQDLFFANIFKDSWNFYKKNFSLALRSSMIAMGFGTVSLVLMIAQAWCAML